MNLEMKMYDRERIGEKRKAREVAMNLLKQNLPVTLIADATGLSETEVHTLKDKGLSVLDEIQNGRTSER